MTQPIVLFDDDCVKCRRWARFIEARNDSFNVRLIGQNTLEGQLIIDKMPDSFAGIDSVFLLLPEDDWYAKSSAIWRICRFLRFPWPIASIFALIPWPIRDLAYDRFARQRK